MEKTATSISWPILISFTAGFFTISGGLWHLGYWSTFKFNYFEYTSLVDLFKSSFYLFAERTWIVIGFIAMPTGLSLLSKRILYINKLNIKNDETNADLKRDTTMDMIADITIAVCLAIVTFFTIMSSSDGKLLLIASALSIATASFLLKYNILSTVIKNDDLKFAIILIISFYPTFNFFIGKQTSLDVINFEKGSFVVDFKSNNQLLNSDVLGRPYLGSTTDYYFVFLGRRNDVCAIKKDIVDNITVSKGWFKDDIPSLRSYEERISFRDSYTLIIDTNRSYYDPALKIHYDSFFRASFRNNYLNNR